MLAINSTLVTVSFDYFFVTTTAAIENLNGLVVALLHMLVMSYAFIDFLLLPRQMINKLARQLSTRTTVGL